jgi:ferredoxin
VTDARWRISVDRDTCIGSAVCVGTMPGRFRLVDDKSQPVTDEIDADDDVIAVAESCPMEAITVTNAATGEVLAPEA